MTDRRTPLARVSTVDALADRLRREILAGDPPPGTWLRERELTAAYGVARHTLRAALRELASERLVQLEPHRGARVAVLDPDELRALFALRAALEVEAARLALERGDPEPPAVGEAFARLDAACAAPTPDRRAIDDAHADLHHALVAAAHSPRILQAHQALDAETRIFLLQLRPHWSPQEMARQHRELLDALPHEGPDALRRHLFEAIDRLLGARPDA